MSQNNHSAIMRIENTGQALGQMLPSTAMSTAMFVRVAQGALRRNPQLEKVANENPESLISALMTAARLGLEPGTEQFYLVPFGSEIQGITGYQGEVELMYRAGVQAVYAELVHANDQFSYHPGQPKPEHAPDWFADRGDIKGSYAYALVDGIHSKVVVVGRSEIAAAMREAKGSDKPTSAWQKHYGAMVLKTAVHRLARWVPTSAERLSVLARADAERGRTVTRREEPVVAVPTSVSAGGPPVVDTTHLDDAAHNPTTGEVTEAEVRR